MAADKLPHNRMLRNALTPEYIRRVLTYERSTGILRWRKNPDRTRAWNSRYAGSEAGGIGVNGYRYMNINCCVMLCHIVIWYLVTGEWPDHQIDHKDQNPLNNRWNNLRRATNAQNSQNSPKRSFNRNGFKGVTRNHKRWMAVIQANNKVHYLGTYDTKEEAHAAYCAAADRLHGRFASHD